MGGKSSTSTSTSSSTNVQELNLQDTGGFTAADNKNTSITYVNTDSGATSAALKANTAATKAALYANADVSREAIAGNTDVSLAAINLGSNALASGNQVANHGLDAASAAYESGLTFGTDAIQTVKQLAQEFSTQNETLTASALNGYQSIAEQNSASDATQIQKIAIYVIVAAVAIVVLPKMMK